MVRRFRAIIDPLFLPVFSKFNVGTVYIEGSILMNISMRKEKVQKFNRNEPTYTGGLSADDGHEGLKPPEP